MGKGKPYGCGPGGKVGGKEGVGRACIIRLLYQIAIDPRMQIGPFVA